MKAANCSGVVGAGVAPCAVSRSRMSGEFRILVTSAFHLPITSLGVPAGAELFPSKAAGYWLMIDGLSPGPHTLRFGGSSVAFTPGANCCTNGAFPAFSQDTTANITAVPEPASALLILSGLLGMLTLRRTRLQAGLEADLHDQLLMAETECSARKLSCRSF